MRNQPKHLVAVVFPNQENNITALLDMIDECNASIG